MILTKLFFLKQLQAYGAAFVNKTGTAQLTEISVWDVVAFHTHTVNMLPHTANTIHVHFN